MLQMQEPGQGIHFFDGLYPGTITNPPISRSTHFLGRTCCPATVVTIVSATNVLAPSFAPAHRPRPEGQRKKHHRRKESNPARKARKRKRGRGLRHGSFGIKRTGRQQKLLIEGGGGEVACTSAAERAEETTCWNFPLLTKVHFPSRIFRFQKRYGRRQQSTYVGLVRT